MKALATLFVAVALTASFAGVALAEQQKVKCPACGYEFLAPSDQ